MKKEKKEEQDILRKEGTEVQSKIQSRDKLRIRRKELKKIKIK